jgi:hypothetical protein
MIVGYFDIIGVIIFPYKTDSPLVINSYAILPGSISTQLLQSVRWWEDPYIGNLYECICGICIKYIFAGSNRIATIFLLCGEF